MRMREILRESIYFEELKNYVIDILTSYRSQDISELKFDSLLNDLIDSGFISVDRYFLIDFLDTLEFVEEVNPNDNLIKIHLEKVEDEKDESEEGSDKENEEGEDDDVDPEQEWSEDQEDSAMKAVKDDAG